MPIKIPGLRDRELPPACWEGVFAGKRPGWGEPSEDLSSLSGDPLRILHLSGKGRGDLLWRADEASNNMETQLGKFISFQSSFYSSKSVEEENVSTGYWYVFNTSLTLLISLFKREQI